jgi:hypothetical protein
MLKKLAFLAVALLMLSGIAQAESHIMTGGQLIFNVASCHEIGGGIFSSYGVDLSQYMTLWGGYQGEKPQYDSSFINVDAILGGITVKTPYAIDKIKLGGFFLGQLGGAKAVPNPTAFSYATGAGFYIDTPNDVAVVPVTTWLGLTYTGIDKLKTVGLMLGFSWELK